MNLEVHPALGPLEIVLGDLDLEASTTLGDPELVIADRNEHPLGAYFCTALAAEFLVDRVKRTGQLYLDERFLGFAIVYAEPDVSADAL